MIGRRRVPLGGRLDSSGAPSHHPNGGHGLERGALQSLCVVWGQHMEDNKAMVEYAFGLRYQKRARRGRGNHFRGSTRTIPFPSPHFHSPFVVLLLLAPPIPASPEAKASLSLHGSPSSRHLRAHPLPLLYTCAALIVARAGKKGKHQPRLHRPNTPTHSGPSQPLLSSQNKHSRLARAQTLCSYVAPASRRRLITRSIRPVAT
jgi:hypothetical protein